MRVIKNLSASVRSQLMNHAKQQCKPFNEILQHFMLWSSWENWIAEWRIFMIYGFCLKDMLLINAGIITFGFGKNDEKRW